jgi:hypothetical protein
MDRLIRCLSGSLSLSALRPETGSEGFSEASENGCADVIGQGAALAPKYAVDPLIRVLNKHLC